ncbi:hypothetical protein [uncultured Desulfovibrio sp.]|uniref:hypothetical protein n=1 Tax=uncultured Desulfovibrio sp. TaxID=167968 RepID=UPI00039CD134|nr:hypothetical protein [uncultured Desulfovibrio sp.]
MLVQDDINRMLTILGYFIDFQGFSTGFIKGADQELRNTGLTLGPGTLVCLPDNGEMGFAAPTLPWTRFFPLSAI